jgi:hypothetical protein
MARIHRFSGVQHALAAGVAQTVIFPSNEIEGAGVIAFNIHLNGAGNDLNDIDGVRVLASGDLIMDVSVAQLRTWIEGTHKTGFVQALTETVLHVPLYMPDLVDRDARDSCQFPAGAQPQVEVDMLATVAAGNAIISWTKTDQQPRLASRYYSSVLNIAASQNNARYPFSDGGIIRGVTYPTVGVSRARLVISDREAWRISGAQFLGATWGDFHPQIRMGEQPYTILTPLFNPCSLGLPAAVGSSFLELDTGAAWVGVTNEIAIWSVVPLAQEGEEV